MKVIYDWLQRGAYPNCSTIALELEVSRKTVKRDLEFMRDRLQLPLEYDGGRHGYYFAKPLDGFPGVSLTPAELAGLCGAHKAIEPYAGTTFQQRVEVTYRKLVSHLDATDRLALDNLDKAVSFRPCAPEAADARAFQLATRAITEGRALQFEYRKPGETRAGTRQVQPYHLLAFEDRWYLIGHDVDRGGIRTFVLGRMRQASLTGERFARPAGFDPKAYLGKSLGVMAGSGDFEVVVALDAWLADVLRGRRWHPSQEWREQPEGGAHLRLRLSALEEIERWILSWGAHARVLRPEALAHRIRAIARAVLDHYPSLI